MEEVIIEIVGLQVLERVFIHLQGRFPGVVSEVGKLGRNIIGVPRIAAQGDARSPFRLATQVGGGGIVIIDSVGHGVVDHLVHGGLVDYVIAFFVLDHRPPHAAVSEEGNAVSVPGIGPHGHLPRPFFSCGCVRLGSTGGSTQGYSPGAGYFEEISSVHNCFSFRVKRSGGHDVRRR